MRKGEPLVGVDEDGPELVPDVRDPTVEREAPTSLDLIRAINCKVDLREMGPTSRAKVIELWREEWPDEAREFVLAELLRYYETGDNVDGKMQRAISAVRSGLLGEV